MSLSGYQVESFLNELRQIWGLRTNVPAYYEPSTISQEGRVWSQNMPKRIPYTLQETQETWIAPNQIIELIGDTTPYDPIIEWERQRRAGLFVNPVYVPENPPPAFSLIHAPEIQANEPKYQTESLPAQTQLSEHHQLPAQETLPVTKPQTEVPQQNEMLQEPVDLEEDFQIDEKSESSQEQMDADVIYGHGRITEEATISFLKNYPDSALKFLFSRELDGKALNQTTLKIHVHWQKRGLSKQKLYHYICDMMNWEKIPKLDIAELFSQIQDTVLD